jgi:hypothetical protein
VVPVAGRPGARRQVRRHVAAARLAARSTIGVMAGCILGHRMWIKAFSPEALRLGPPAPRRGLDRNPEYGVSCSAEGSVGSVEGQDGLLGAADLILWHGSRLDSTAFEEVGKPRLGRRHEPVVGIRGLGGEVRRLDGVVIEATGPQNRCIGLWASRTRRRRLRSGSPVVAG